MSNFASNPSSVAAPDGDFSQAFEISAGARFLFISGQVPRSVDGNTVGLNSMRDQAEQVFMNLKNILQSHGMTFASAVKATIFVTDMSLASEVVEVRRKYYGDARPASTFVAVSELGDPRWLLEVELVAAA